MYNLCSRQTYICLCDFLRVMVKSAFFPREIGKNHNLVSVKKAVKLKNHQHQLSVGIYDFFFLTVFVISANVSLEEWVPLPGNI